MDKEQIRIAVAKELGWTKDYIQGNGLDCDMWFHPSSGMCYHDLPKYPDSLDDCQEMLANLKDEELHIFDKHLSEIPEVGYSWLAKPIDLCVAFLQTRKNPSVKEYPEWLVKFVDGIDKL
jgi:hypothetical protein